MPQERDQLSQKMDAASSGDDAAFGEIALEAQDRLFRFAVAHGLRHADAAEAVQETFLRAYRARRRWRPGSDVVSWLYGIAMNVIRERRRHRSRREVGDLGIGFRLASPRDGPDNAVELDEDLQRLTAAIEELPLRQREVVICRYLRRMSVRQTAEAMGCAEGTVKAAAFAALENLRKLLRETHER